MKNSVNIKLTKQLKLRKNNIKMVVPKIWPGDQTQTGKPQLTLTKP